jgi:cell division protein ZapA (FtsZ GTPase activity inhibitor)
LVIYSAADMAKLQNTEIRLLGQKVVLKPSETDPEIVRQVVQLATAKLNEAESRSQGAAPHQIALIALLDLAEEYIKAKKRTVDFKRQLDEKSSKLLSLVEADFK